MTCRRCRGEHQPPYEIADVMSFIVPAVDDTDQFDRDDADDIADDPGNDRDSPHPPGEDRPQQAQLSPRHAYRFAWNGEAVTS